METDMHLIAAAVRRGKRDHEPDPFRTLRHRPYQLAELVAIPPVSCNGLPEFRGTVTDSGPRCSTGDSGWPLQNV